MYREKSINTNVFLGSLFITALLVFITYGITRWLGVEPGDAKNWIVGLLVLWWLVIIVTLPWDLYFKSRALVLDTQHSNKAGMNIAESDIVYVKRWAKISFVLAISLHIISAAALAALEFYGVSELGYYAAGAAILLMGFRPAWRAYDYLVMRLTNIGREIRYPRDDVMVLKNQVDVLTEKLNQLSTDLNREKKESWASSLETRLNNLATKQSSVHTELSELRSSNDEAHKQMAIEAEAAAAKVAGGAKVIGHVRELVRFFKDA